MDENKRQPEEHEVLAEIHSVISNNPEFGSKRVASSIKSSNPDWHIGDKRARGTWHPPPPVPAPRPRARGLCPLPDQQPVQVPEVQSPPAETEPEPDVVSSAVTKDLPAKEPVSSAFSSAFEPEKDEAPASSAWTAAPVQAEEIAQTSPWTSAATETSELVQETVEKPTEKTPQPVVEKVAAPVEKEVVSEVREEVVEREAEPETQEQVEEITSRGICCECVDDGSCSGDPKPVVEETEPAVEEVAVEEEAPVVEESTAIEEPVKESVEETVAHVEEVVVPREKEQEQAATSSAWTTTLVQEEPVSAWTTAPVKEEPAVNKPVVEEVEKVAEEPFQKETTPVVTEPVVEPVEKVEEAPVASPWTSAPVHKAVESAAPVPEKVAEVAETVKEPVKETPAPVVEEPAIPVKEEVAAVVEEVAAPVAAVAVVEKEVPAASSAWNTTPVQEEVKAVVVEKIETVKESAAEPQKEFVVKETVAETKESSASAVKEVVVATEAVFEDAKIDKKAIANAFDGVSSYKVDSVSRSRRFQVSRPPPPSRPTHLARVAPAESLAALSCSLLRFALVACHAAIVVQRSCSRGASCVSRRDASIRIRSISFLARFALTWRQWPWIHVRSDWLQHGF
ncbi:Ankyrin-1 [Phytophthora nicotianae]|uniref:Ankyrin-1 n=1 Tax=Phytophthora nicotianae TaxID=4792 RepID=A0A0W8CZQ5_PHYNI|nr:Ankyrin-1 [Phytophthora nicotianae]